eukprot:7387348-Prymnesium_polylepis.3
MLPTQFNRFQSLAQPYGVKGNVDSTFAAFSVCADLDAVLALAAGCRAIAGSMSRHSERAGRVRWRVGCGSGWGRVGPP